ncbi:MAG: GreA/GreB family elongation factor [Vicinamibacteria bacterium]
MQKQNVRVTEVDSRKLQALIDGALRWDNGDASNLERLEDHLHTADVIPPSQIGHDVVTMGSDVLLTDLDSDEKFRFQVVFPLAANTAARKFSVLAPLGMAVLGRKVGEEFTWEVPSGVRRLRVDDLLDQPERDGRDLSIEPMSPTEWRRA